MIQPRGNLVLIEMDPEDRRIGESKILVAPDEKRLKFCRRCGTMMEALDDTPGCWISIEEYLDGEERLRHDIVNEPFPVVLEASRWGTVLALGSKARTSDFDCGSRVLIDAEAGHLVPGCAFRLVPAEAIMAVAE